MPDPMDAFPPVSLDKQLEANPDANDYIDMVVAIAVERGHNPSWKAVIAALGEYGIRVTTNPVKRVVETRIKRAQS